MLTRLGGLCAALIYLVAVGSAWPLLAQAQVKPDAPSQAAQAAPAPKRVALVIAIADYGPGYSLANPIVDGQLVSQGFKDANFKVRMVTNPGREKLLDELRSFEVEAAAADIAAIYIAGSGVQINGTDYLFPSGTLPKIQSEVAAKGLAVSQVIRASQKAKRLALIAVDACRNNPFVSYSGTGSTRGIQAAQSKGFSRGLVATEQSRIETILVYGTSGGEVALDGLAGTGSPFARAFAKRLRESGDILRVMGRVGEDVRAETRGAQRPEVTVANMSGQPFCVNNCGSAARAEQVTKAPERDYSAAECVGTYKPKAGGPVRPALLIGNWEYEGKALDRLVSPFGDVERMGKAMDEAGHQVRTCYNLGLDGLRRELSDYKKVLAEAVAGSAGAAAQKPSGFVYFSGHGASNGGKNFWIPVRSGVETCEDLDLKALKLSEVAEALKGASANVVFVVSDSCRNELKCKTKGDGSKGFDIVVKVPGIFYAFSTAPGYVAYDTPVYSQVLAKQIASSKEEAKVLFGDVADEVLKLSKEQQRPYAEPDYVGRFYFRPPS